jgi:hypothetical protein
MQSIVVVTVGVALAFAPVTLFVALQTRTTERIVVMPAPVCAGHPVWAVRG